MSIEQPCRLVQAFLPDRLVNPQRYTEMNRPLDPIHFDEAIKMFGNFNYTSLLLIAYIIALN